MLMALVVGNALAEPVVVVSRHADPFARAVREAVQRWLAGDELTLSLTLENYSFALTRVGRGSSRVSEPRSVPSNVPWLACVVDSTGMFVSQITFIELPAVLPERASCGEPGTSLHREFAVREREQLLSTPTAGFRGWHEFVGAEAVESAR